MFRAIQTGEDVRANLVLLASYPKSGNTWLRAFLASAMNGGRPVDINANPGGTLRGADRALFDASLERASGAMTIGDIVRARPGAWARIAARSPATLWVKVHDAWAPFAPNCPYPYPAAQVRGVVHIVRDPRDVAVSFAHHFDLAIDEAIAWMADPNAMLDADPDGQTPQLPQLLSSWSANVASWRAATDLNVLTVRYEDMHDAAAATFGRIAAWMGLGLSAAVVADAVRQSAFDRLQAQERAAGFRESDSTDTRFFRQGRAGGWRNVLSAAQAAAIGAAHGEVMHACGYIP